MNRRLCVAVLALAGVIASPPARAEAIAPEAFVRQLSDDIIGAVKADRSIQSGDLARIRALVDDKVMPSVNFPRMVASAVGPSWRSATPAQKTRMQEEFKTLLVNTYSGALTQVKDQTVQVKPFRGSAEQADVIVRSEVRSRAEPVQLDYRLEKAGESWKIYDVNVGGFWLVEAYRGQFARDLANGGMDALIATLAAKNKSQSASAPKS
jgi:phospholipid transport system substrate-binding protein